MSGKVDSKILFVDFERTKDLNNEINVNKINLEYIFISYIDDDGLVHTWNFDISKERNLIRKLIEDKNFYNYKFTIWNPKNDEELKVKEIFINQDYFDIANFNNKKIMDKIKLTNNKELKSISRFVEYRRKSEINDLLRFNKVINKYALVKECQNKIDGYLKFDIHEFMGLVLYIVKNENECFLTDLENQKLWDIFCDWMKAEAEFVFKLLNSNDIEIEELKDDNKFIKIEYR